MNPITVFLAAVCIAIGAGLGAIGHLYAGIALVIVAIVIASALKMANTWEKFVILRAGKLALREGSKDEALRLFRLAPNECPKTFNEWASAKAEIKMLGAKP